MLSANSSRSFVLPSVPDKEPSAPFSNGGGWRLAGKSESKESQALSRHRSFVPMKPPAAAFVRPPWLAARNTKFVGADTSTLPTVI
jgi:hypothetical protein